MMRLENCQQSGVWLKCWEGVVVLDLWILVGIVQFEAEAQVDQKQRMWTGRPCNCLECCSNQTFDIYNVLFQIETFVLIIQCYKTCLPLLTCQFLLALQEFRIGVRLFDNMSGVVTSWQSLTVGIAQQSLVVVTAKQSLVVVTAKKSRSISRSRSAV